MLLTTGVTLPPGVPGRLALELGPPSRIAELGSAPASLNARAQVGTRAEGRHRFPLEIAPSWVSAQARGGVRVDYEFVFPTYRF